MTADAIIVGSGPGGATVADVLTRGRVVRWSSSRRDGITRSTSMTRAGCSRDYSNDEIKFVDRFFLGPDPFLEPRTFRLSEDDGDHSFVGEVNTIPSTVGGGGIHADGKVPRFLEEASPCCRPRRRQEGAAVADWPLDYAELEPYYADVERRIGVSGLAGANPFAPCAGSLPDAAGDVDVRLDPVIGRRRVASASIPTLHPAPSTRCPTTAVRPATTAGSAPTSPAPSMPRATRWPCCSGRCWRDARASSETFVSRIRTDGRRATGVDFIGPDGVERSMDARHVVVAGGAVETPRLLLLSGFEHPLIGRHLMTHFQTIVVGGFPHRVPLPRCARPGGDRDAR